MNKKILILGGTGLIGSYLVDKFSVNGDKVTSISRSNSSSTAAKQKKINLALRSNFTKLKNLELYDLVINCIAFTSQAKCEIDIEETWSLHVELSRFLESKTLKGRYLYISSVAVYGIKSARSIPVPDSVIRLENWYSKTKYFGEPSSDSFTLRLNIVGLGSKTNRSLLEWAYTELSNNNKIKGYKNFYINPITPKDTYYICQQIIKGELEPGLYNIGSNMVISKYELIRSLASAIQKEELVEPSYFSKNDTNFAQIVKSDIRLKVINNNILNELHEYLEPFKGE